MAVVGLGGVGMNALLGGVVAGAERIVAIDLNAEKLRVARKLGATDTFLAGNEDVIAEVKQATGGGLDYVIETAGSIAAMNLAYGVTARGGMVVSAGLPAVTAQFSYLHGALVSDEKSIRGSYMGSCVPRRDIPGSLRCTNGASCRCRTCAAGLSGLGRSMRASTDWPMARCCARCCSRTHERNIHQRDIHLAADRRAVDAVEDVGGMPTQRAAAGSDAGVRGARL